MPLDLAESGNRAAPTAPGPITVRKVQSAYRPAPVGGTGWFESGQSADLILGNLPHGRTGGPLLFNHPGQPAADAGRFVLPDTRNNRVLIWNSLPSGNIPPDLVLGQPDFDSAAPGSAPDRMNWPAAAAAEGGRLAVADTYNHRILIWNSFPTRNGQPPDLTLDGKRQRDRNRSIRAPWGLHLAGGKLVIANRGGGNVLIYNRFPTSVDQPPDLVLDFPGVFGGPRAVASDGERLVVADYDPYGGERGSGTFFWNQFPTRDNQPHDFFIAHALAGAEGRPRGEMLRAAFAPDGRLVALADNQLYVWNRFPSGATDRPSLVVASTRGSRSSDVRWEFRAGDTSGIALTGDTLFVSLMNGNKVLEYRSIPTTADRAPDFTIGAPSPDADTLAEAFIISNPVPVSNGRSLFVLSDLDRTLNVWERIPDESGAKPDLVYHFPDEVRAIAAHGDLLAVVSTDALYLWTKPPLNGLPPDRVFRGGIGGVRFQDLQGVATDDRYFYLADAGANAIYAWTGTPAEDRPPELTLAVASPRRLSSDGRYLAVQTSQFRPGASQAVHLFRIDGLTSGAGPIGLSPTSRADWDSPQHVLVAHGHLFMADTGRNRVLGWRDVEHAIAGRDPDLVLGAKDLTPPADPMATLDRMYMPYAVSFDGTYLWVGEWKFSPMRLLRFRVGGG